MSDNINPPILSARYWHKNVISVYVVIVFFFLHIMITDKNNAWISPGDIYRGANDDLIKLHREVCKQAPVAAVTSLLALCLTNAMSVVWNYFQVSPDIKLAICNDCKALVMRSGTKTSFNTSNLISHLRMNHSERYAAFVQQSNEKKQPGQAALKKTLS